MIDIGLTNALAQIRDALYEINDTFIKHIMNRGMFKVKNGKKV